MVLAAVVVSAGQIADASGSTAATEHVTVVVQAGQTLWGIARESAPGHDPRLVIAQIRELNDLGTRSIVPGQALVVPTLA
jgi:LysM repeat protein